MEGTERDADKIDNEPGEEEGAVGGAEVAEESPETSRAPREPLYSSVFYVGNRMVCCMPRAYFFEYTYDRVFRVKKRRANKHKARFGRGTKHEFVETEVYGSSSHRDPSEEYVDVVLDPESEPTTSRSYSYFRNIREAVDFDYPEWVLALIKIGKKSKKEKEVHFEKEEEEEDEYEEILMWEHNSDGTYTGRYGKQKRIKIRYLEPPMSKLPRSLQFPGSIALQSVKGPGPKTGVIPEFKPRSVFIPVDLDEDRYRYECLMPIKHKVDPGKFRKYPSSKIKEMLRKMNVNFNLPTLSEQEEIPDDPPPPPVSATTLMYDLKATTEEHQPLETPHEPNLLHAQNEVAIYIPERAPSVSSDDTCVFEIDVGGVQVTAQVHRSSSDEVPEPPSDETTRGAHVRLSRGITYRADDDATAEIVRVNDNVEVRLPVAQQGDGNMDLVVRWSSNRPGTVGAEADEITPMGATARENVTIDINVESSERAQLLPEDQIQSSLEEAHIDIPRSQFQRSIRTARHIAAVLGVPVISCVALTIYFLVEGFPQ